VRQLAGSSAYGIWCHLTPSPDEAAERCCGDIFTGAAPPIGSRNNRTDTEDDFAVISVQPSATSVYAADSDWSPPRGRGAAFEQGYRYFGLELVQPRLKNGVDAG